jgi:ribosomal protein S18 acetylase RimI-like enzyme
VQLVCLQISEEYRRQGIGRKLFSMACEEARQLGADKLYISGHSSKESQAAYRALGCSFTEEINEELAAAEPFDVQMEYRL